MARSAGGVEESSRIATAAIIPRSVKIILLTQHNTLYTMYYIEDSFVAMTATATFRTTPELKKRIDFLAKETNRTSSFYFNLLLEEYLDDLEDIYLSQKVLEDIRSGKERTYTSEEVCMELGV